MATYDACMEIESRRDVPQDRQEAYEVWAWACGRNIGLTAQATGVPERTLRRWARADSWRQRHMQERLAATPSDIVPVVVGTLAAAAVDAAEYLAAVLAGERDPDRDLTAVAMIALDRAGFGVARLMEPMRMEAGTKESATLSPADLERLSPAELRALEQGRSVVSAKREERDAIEVSPA